MKNIRDMVFEVVVLQALAGAPWRIICAGPMSVNSITPEEIEEEVKRRGEGNEFDALVPRKPHKPQGSTSVAIPLPTEDEID